MKEKKNCKCQWKDNRGTSIVELLTVMAILAVFVGVSTNIVGMLSGKQAKQCAYKMEAALSETRVETMSKSNGEKDSVYLTFANVDGEIYAKQKVRDHQSSDFLGKNVTVKAFKMAGGNPDELTAGTEINIYFERSTGALYDEDSNYCKFEVTQGNVTYVVSVVPLTGKVSYERQ